MRFFPSGPEDDRSSATCKEVTDHGAGDGSHEAPPRVTEGGLQRNDRVKCLRLGFEPHNRCPEITPFGPVRPGVGTPGDRDSDTVDGVGDTLGGFGPSLPVLYGLGGSSVGSQVGLANREVSRGAVLSDQRYRSRTTINFHPRWTPTPASRS